MKLEELVLPSSGRLMEYEEMINVVGGQSITYSALLQARDYHYEQYIILSGLSATSAVTGVIWATMGPLGWIGTAICGVTSIACGVAASFEMSSYTNAVNAISQVNHNTSQGNESSIFKYTSGYVTSYIVEIYSGNPGGGGGGGGDTFLIN